MTIGICVSFLKSLAGTASGSTGPLELVWAGGSPPSGNGKLLPGSYATMPRTLELLIADEQYATTVPGERSGD